MLSEHGSQRGKWKLFQFFTKYFVKKENSRYCSEENKGVKKKKKKKRKENVLNHNLISLSVK